jgi:hypothetical protein
MFQAPQYQTIYEIVISGSEIPEWFSHQSLGVEVNIKEPYSHLCNELIGIAVCVVFCSQEQEQEYNPFYARGIGCFLIANGKKVGSAPAY